MVARTKNDSAKAQNRALALEVQRDLQRKFLLEQLAELTGGFANEPEQIGHYLADLEAIGMLSPADKGMVFRSLWETMGPAFADRAFGMTSRALSSGEDLAADIASDAFVDIVGERAVFASPQDYARASDAFVALDVLSKALGLKLDVPRPELKRRQNHDHIIDSDLERADQTAELLNELGDSLGLDAGRVKVHVDETGKNRTADSGIWGLMTGGEVFLDPELYDPSTTEGRHLLAHEMVHVAQFENRLRGANETPDIYAAEAEADTLSATFAQGGRMAAPLATLSAYDQAACGPRQMADDKKEEDEPRQGRTEVKREEGKEEEVIEEETINLEGAIYFHVDKHTIAQTMEPKKSEQVLKDISTKLKAYPEITKIKVVGHASTTHYAAYNMRLSERRAKTVASELTSRGVANTRMTTGAMGEKESRKELNIKDDKSQKEVTRHRRVDFSIAEVNGKPHSGPFKRPNKKVVQKPGRTITREYDADGKLINESVIVDGQGDPAKATNDPKATGETKVTNKPTATPAKEQAQKPAQQSPEEKVVSKPQVTATPDQKPQKKPDDNRDHLKMSGRKKSKEDNKGKRTPRRWATGVIRTVAQPKAAPGGLTSMEIADRTRNSGGGEALSDGIRTHFESAFGQSFSDVRVYRGSSQASSIGATAFARGNDIHFAPGRYDTNTASGMAVLGHELAHIIQQRAGRVSVTQGKGTHVNVDHALEAEADLLGMRAARGERVSVSGSSTALASRASRGEANTIQYAGGVGVQEATETEGQGGPERPKTVDIVIGGQRISATMPASPNSPGRVRVDFSAQAAFAGLQLGAAEIDFDSNWKVQGGRVTASAKIGNYLEANDISLDITARNNVAYVEGNIRGVQFQVGDLLTGTMDLAIGSGGVNGRANIAAGQVNLGHGLSLTEGALNLVLSSSNGSSVSGRLAGTMSAGGVDLQVEVNAQALSESGSLSGSVRLSLANEVALPYVEGVKVTTASITGQYTSGQPWSLTGTVGISVNDWVGASISATYTQGSGGGDGQWGFTGTLSQLQPFTVPGTEAYPLSMRDSSLAVSFSGQQFTQAALTSSWDLPDFTGTVQGTYEVPTKQINGEISARLSSPELAMGDTGGKLTTLEATGQIQANKLTQLTGAITAVLPYEGEDTFQVSASAIVYDVEQKAVSGTGTVSTMRDLVFGNEGSYNATINQGGQAQLTVEANKLLGITGGLAFRVAHGAEVMGDGNIDVNFQGDNNAFNGTARFGLTGTFGLPDHAQGPVMLKPGGEFELTVNNSQLGTASARNIEFEVVQLGREDGGAIAGTLNGNFDFQTQMLNATANARIAKSWTEGPELAEATILEGGTLSVAIADSQITSAEGDFLYNLAVVSGQEDVLPFVLEGKLSGSYAIEGQTFNGLFNGNLVTPIDIKTGIGQFRVVEGANFEATISDSNPGVFKAGFTAQYLREGELFLEGQVADASYIVESNSLNFQSTLTLKKDIETSATNGGYKLAVTAGTQVGAEVADSQLKLLNGEILTEVRDDKGALFKGSLQNAELDVEQLQFSGTIDFALARDIGYPEGEGEAPAVQVLAKKEVSRVTGTITANAISTLEANFEFGVNLMGEEYAAGQIGGTLTVDTMMFDGTGRVNLTRDFIVGEPAEATQDDVITAWLLVFPVGQGLDISIKQNQVDEANINLNCKYLQNDAMAAEGTVNGSYKLGDPNGFNGTATANVSQDIEVYKDERFTYVLQPGTSLSGEMVRSQITSASGNLTMAANEVQGGQVIVTAAGSYAAGAGVDAQGDINVTQPILIKEGGEWKIFIAQGSAGTATVKQNKLEVLGGTLKLDLTKTEQPFAVGDFQAEYRVADGANAQINAEGTVSLLSELDITPGGAGGFGVWLTGGTEIKASIQASELQWIDGQLLGKLTEGGSDLATYDIKGKYTAGSAPDFTGEGELTTIRNLEITKVADYTLYLGTAAGITGKITAFQLEQLTANIPLELHKNAGTPTIKALLEGTYTHADKIFNGTGSFDVVEEIKIVESQGDKVYGLYIGTSTGLSGVVSNNELTEMSGNLQLLVTDGPTPAEQFISGQIGGTYKAGAAAEFTGTGSVSVTREKEIATVGDYTLLLTPSTGITGAFTANELTSLEGGIGLRLDKGTPFAQLTLNGKYTPAEGFSGNAEGQLLQEVEVGSASMAGVDYGFFLMPSTGATAKMANNTLEELGGTLTAMIRESGADFIKLDFNASYKVTEQLFSGDGAIAVMMDKKLGELGGEQLWLGQGTSAEGKVEDNQVTQLAGDLTLQLKDSEKHWLDCKVNGSFDTTGSTGFTGEGTITVLAEKELAKIGNYRFALDKGTGATASIKENALTEVAGKVPFLVYDAESEPLIKGSAEGKYLAAEQEFSGTGDVRLGRDVTFDLSGNSKIIIKKDSGGNGEVVKNELKRLGGNLEVLVQTDGKDMFSVSGEGEFDAVESKLIRLSGKAALLQTLDIGGDGAQALLQVTQFTGEGLVENNELKQIEGSIEAIAPKFNNSKGTFTGGWQKTTSEDVFWAKGSLELNIFEDAAKQRSLKGTVEAEYKRDKTFSVTGELDYSLNQYLKGKLGIQMDQNLDPVLSGTISAENVPLARGRSLFNWSKEISLLKMQLMAGPVPITFQGGVGVGLNLDMNDLLLSASASISNFRPMQAQVPDFSATATMSTGLNFKGELAPYLSLGVGVAGLASGGAFIKGSVGASVTATLTPSAKLEGKGGVYSGELGIGAKITGSGSLGVTPGLYAEILGSRHTWDLHKFEHNLGNLFSIDYNYTMPFGDRPAAARPGGAAQQPMPAQTQQSNQEMRTRRPVSTPAVRSAANEPNGPQFLSSQQASQGQDKSGPMDAVKAKLDQVQQQTADLQNLISVGSELFGALKWLVSPVPPPLNFAGTAAALAYSFLSGKLSKDKIVRAAQTFKSLVSKVGSALYERLVPARIRQAWEAFNRSPSEYIRQIFDGVVSWARSGAPVLADIVKELVGMVGNAAETVIEFVSAIQNGGLNASFLLKVARRLGKAAGKIVRQLVSMAGDAIGDAARSARDWVGGLFD